MWLSRVIQYELVVECIENYIKQNKSFAISEIWKELGGGPTLYNITKIVFRDLELHNLLIRTGRGSALVVDYIQRKPKYAPSAVIYKGI